ncbi:hypothetical protein HUJ05_009644 [Dendroctonus ponderosae]|nr:hypothetical protein HUJ05_009644 [Dendroctonus ponderosae]
MSIFHRSCTLNLSLIDDNAQINPGKDRLNPPTFTTCPVRTLTKRQRKNGQPPPLRFVMIMTPGRHHLVVATLALCASAHAGIILKGPSGIITPNGPIGPDGRGAGAGWVGAGAWSGDDGSWDGDDGSWKGEGAWGGNDIILKGPSGAITKNGPIGPDAIQAGWGGEGAWGGDDGQWRGDNGAWNGGWGEDDGQWKGDNGAWNGGWGEDDGQWRGDSGSWKKW